MPMQTRFWLKHCVIKAIGGKNGGITVSGGEPLLQIDFLLELFTKAKQKGIHTVMDTMRSAVYEGRTVLFKI